MTEGKEPAMNDHHARLLAESEIKSMLERYYRDTAQWSDFRNAYHPDAFKTSIKIAK